MLSHSSCNSSTNEPETQTLDQTRAVEDRYGAAANETEACLCSPVHFDQKLLEVIPRNIIELAEKRLQSRKNKEWDEADRLRSKVSELGYQIEDNNDGYSVSKL